MDVCRASYHNDSDGDFVVIFEAGKKCLLCKALEKNRNLVEEVESLQDHYKQLKVVINELKQKMEI